MDYLIVNKQDFHEMENRIINAVTGILKDKNKIKEDCILYNNKDACAYLKVCSKTLQNYRDDGLLQFTQVGRKIYYTQPDLNAFLEKYKKDTFLNIIKNK